MAGTVWTGAIILAEEGLGQAFSWFWPRHRHAETSRKCHQEETCQAPWRWRRHLELRSGDFGLIKINWKFLNIQNYAKAAGVTEEEESIVTVDIEDIMEAATVMKLIFEAVNN